ncbi:MAG: SDR family oxidoreductase [Ilumatobacteraceae bacterium]
MSEVEIEERTGERRLEGRTAIVMGAGQTPGETLGNGRATALLFARHGASVVVADRVPERAEATAAEIAALGGTAVAVTADATIEDDCERVVAETRSRFGELDIVQYNVGIGGRDGSPTRIDPDVWDRIHSVNVKGAYLMARCALPSMREQGRGVFTFVSSIASICATDMVAYKTSKAALNALTEQIAVQNARFGIRANAVLPGLLDTPMAIEGIAAARGMDRDELRAERSAQVPLGAMGTAWDCAYASLFLASDEARFVTGVLLPVDGGQSARRG